MIFKFHMIKSRTSLVAAVVVATVLLWSAGPGARAVSDSQLKLACGDMTPRHPGFWPQTIPNPYRLRVDASESSPVIPGNLMNVTLDSVDGTTPFKGFMVQARDLRGHVLGTWMPDCRDGGNKSHHMISCSNGAEPYVSSASLLSRRQNVLHSNLVLTIWFRKPVQRVP